MKKTYFLTVILIIFISRQAYAQVLSSFIVQGDIDKFYPVTFVDGARSYHVGTELNIGRSSVHENSSWRGSLIAGFEFHVTAWGNGSNFIKADIIPSTVGLNTTFIAGWRDATSQGTCTCVIIWLRGGGTTYYYKSNYAVNPTIYDGVQNPLPYNELNGPAHSYKTVLDNYVSTTGIYQDRNAYFMGNVGIGTVKSTSKLTVAGDINSREVKVTVNAGADFVFAEDYNLPSLDSVDKYIKENKHLPEIASAKEMQENGINLSEMNIKLLQKMEEMTLYMIEQEKRINAQSLEMMTLKNLEERLFKIEKSVKNNK